LAANAAAARCAEVNTVGSFALFSSSVTRDDSLSVTELTSSAATTTEANAGDSFAAAGAASFGIFAASDIGPNVWPLFSLLTSWSWSLGC
jgi:hypothetical protein